MDITKSVNVLIFGGQNLINNLLLNQCKKLQINSKIIESLNINKSNIEILQNKSLLQSNDNYEKYIYNLINSEKPTHIIYYSDLIEDIPEKIVKTHLIIPLYILQLCEKSNIHMTYIGSGYIYKNIDKINYYFSDNDEGNNYDSPYLIAQSSFNNISKQYYDLLLYIKIKYPIYIEKNISFLSKLYKNSKICEINNSITVLNDFIPEIINWIMLYKIGKINCVNEGKLEATELIAIYAQYSSSIETEYKNEDNEKIESLKSLSPKEDLDNKYSFKESRKNLSKSFKELKETSYYINNIDVKSKLSIDKLLIWYKSPNIRKTIVEKLESLFKKYKIPISPPNLRSRSIVKFK